MIKLKILYNNKKKWRSIKKKSSTILFNAKKDFAEKFFDKDFDFKKINDFEFFLNNSGSFNNFIFENSDYIICGVDKLNSDNIYYYKTENLFYISNDIQEIIKINKSNLKFNNKSYIDTKLLGYVMGGETIVEGIKSLQAGKYILINKRKPEFVVKSYFNFFSSLTTYQRKNDPYKKLKKIEDKIFDDLIIRNKNKKILLALSGGLDSRYVLSSLIKRNFNNITLYSYGHKNNYDSFVSKQIAKKLNIEWKMFETSKDSYKEIYNSDIKNNYWKFADQGIMAPNLYFYEAVKKISEEYDVNKITIVNGQAGDFITGNHLPDFKNKEYLNGKYISDVIFNKHFQLNKKINKKKEIIEDYTSRILNDLNIKKDKFYHYQEVAKYLDYWEWKERQTKRVINMQKIYDFFNIDWELPLWHEEYINFWVDQPYETKVGRNLFRNYLIQTDTFSLFQGKEKELPKWLTSNEYITVIGKLIKLVFSSYGSEYYYSFMNLFCKYGFMYSPYSFSLYLKKFNEYKDPLAFLNDDWIKLYQKQLK
jgi:asparagine synthase (glutamine-hydrolysing)